MRPRARVFGSRPIGSCHESNCTDRTSATLFLTPVGLKAAVIRARARASDYRRIGITTGPLRGSSTGGGCDGKLRSDGKPGAPRRRIADRAHFLSSSFKIE
jgi:hypothetical protein